MKRFKLDSVGREHGFAYLKDVIQYKKKSCKFNRDFGEPLPSFDGAWKALHLKKYSNGRDRRFTAARLQRQSE